MITTIVICSSLSLAALALRQESGVKPWYKRALNFFNRRSSVNEAAAPVITRDSGWTFIRSDDQDSFKSWLHEDEEGMPFKFGEEPSLGSHLLIELYGCDPSSLEREDHVGQVMHNAAVASEATIVTDSFHEFQPYGVSGAVIIQESHYTIHTWPEHKYAAVDLFYCGGTIKVHNAVDVLREGFRPSKIKFLVVRRGLEGEVARHG